MIYHFLFLCELGPCLQAVIIYSCHLQNVFWRPPGGLLHTLSDVFCTLIRYPSVGCSVNITERQLPLLLIFLCYVHPQQLVLGWSLSFLRATMNSRRHSQHSTQTDYASRIFPRTGPRNLFEPVGTSGILTQSQKGCHNRADHEVAAAEGKANH